MDTKTRIASVFQIKRPKKTAVSCAADQPPTGPEAEETSKMADKGRIFTRNSSHRTSSRRSNKYKRNRVKKMAEEFEKNVQTSEAEQIEVTEEDNQLYQKLTGKVKSMKTMYEADSKLSRRKKIRSFAEAETEAEKESYRKSLVEEFDQELANMMTDGFIDDFDDSASIERNFDRSDSLKTQKSIDSASGVRASIDGKESIDSAPEGRSYSASSNGRRSIDSASGKRYEIFHSASNDELKSIGSASDERTEMLRSASVNGRKCADSASGKRLEIFDSASIDRQKSYDSASRKCYEMFHSASNDGRKFIASASDERFEVLDSASIDRQKSYDSASRKCYEMFHSASNDGRKFIASASDERFEVLDSASIDGQKSNDSASRKRYEMFHSATNERQKFIASASDERFEVLDSASIDRQKSYDSASRKREMFHSVSNDELKSIASATAVQKTRPSDERFEVLDSASIDRQKSYDSASRKCYEMFHSASNDGRKFIASASDERFEVLDSASIDRQKSYDSASRKREMFHSVSNDELKSIASATAVQKTRPSDERFEVLDSASIDRQKSYDSASRKRSEIPHSASVDRQKSIDSASGERLEIFHSASNDRQKSTDSASGERLEIFHSASNDRQKSTYSASEERVELPPSTTINRQKSVDSASTARRNFIRSNSNGKRLDSAALTRESESSVSVKVESKFNDPFRDPTVSASDSDLSRHFRRFKLAAAERVDSAADSIESSKASASESFVSASRSKRSAAESVSASEEFSESLGDELEDGAFFVEAYNDDGRELVIVQLSVDRKVVDLDSALSIGRAAGESELVFYKQAGSSDLTMLEPDDLKLEEPEYVEVFYQPEAERSKRSTMYSTDSSAFEEDDEGIYEDPVYNNIRRETFCDDQGVIRIERVGYPEKFKDEQSEDSVDGSGLERNDSLASAKKLHYIVDELKTTERKYVEDLEKVVRKYIPYIERNAPPHLRGTTEKIFGNIAKIYRKQRKFMEALERTADEDTDGLAGCFIEYEHLFDLYPNYLKNKPRADVLIREFSSVVKQMQERYNEKLDFSAYLLTPLQRLGKYILFLEKIEKELTKLKIESERVEFSLRIVKAVMARGNDCVAIESIENSPISKMDYGSFIMREKFTVLKPRRLECVVFLFTDVVVFTFSEQKNVELFNYCDSIKMHHLRIASFEDGTIHLTDFPKTKRKFNASKYTYVLENKSAKVRDTWREAIEKLLWQQLFREKEHLLKVSQANDRKSKPSRNRTKSSGKPGSAVFYVD